MQMEIFFEGKKLKVTFGLSSFLTSFQRCHFLWVHPSFIKKLLWFYFWFNFNIFSTPEAVFFAKVVLKVTYFCFVPFIDDLKFLTFHYFNRLLLYILQLNKYETAPYFFLLNQNLTCDCLLISVFYPVFTWVYLVR